jgi:hypothetical protein
MEGQAGEGEYEIRPHTKQLQSNERRGRQSSVEARETPLDTAVHFPSLLFLSYCSVFFIVQNKRVLGERGLGGREVSASWVLAFRRLLLKDGRICRLAYHWRRRLPRLRRLYLDSDRHALPPATFTFGRDGQARDNRDFAQLKSYYGVKCEALHEVASEATSTGFQEG